MHSQHINIAVIFFPPSVQLQQATPQSAAQIKDHTEMCKPDFIVSLHYENTLSQNRVQSRFDAWQDSKQ